MNDIQFATDDKVQHPEFGRGSVLIDEGETVVIRFEGGIESCEKTDLSTVSTPLQAISLSEWHPPLKVVTRIQAEAIQSINDAWGVFSPSRIVLLPHQLWVCRRVQEEWPTRWLIADDVGLGKTIEAGLVLWPLLAKERVKRLLILAPASLVEQWQYRLGAMFDIRITRYAAETDTQQGGFWQTHNQVIASLNTLRLDRHGRHERLFEGDPWDLLIVDEAHHLNADEKSGPTLGYKLVQQLVDAEHVKSMLFFTGTPHRGKNYGFLSLLRLLQPDKFNPHESLHEHLPKLREVMIRNNKQNVTDLQGRRLFHETIVKSETYSYSDEESEFYTMLTEFIATGKTYASTLPSDDERLVKLVLITMQKLASSSVAAIRRALKKRLDRVVDSRNKLKELNARISAYKSSEQEGNLDEVSRLDEQIAEVSEFLRLMEDEVSRVSELVAAAERVGTETKIQKIIDLVENQYPNRPVLLFTEYKATQALMLSSLMQRFGDSCVTFINGDDRADEVVDSAGRIQTLRETRESAAEKFNAGEARYLVSTEAGGEGIDLQERCHTLIHIDLPWNPMRLHQRVGRLNRYGQTRMVEVVSLRNPDTIESKIWDKLDAKIHNITLALGQVMDEPEDLRQLVLGMTSPAIFRDLFSGASDISEESLSDWFNEKTAQFGGEDAIDVVKDLVGNCDKFDFQQVSSQIPPLDLPDLQPFFLSMLRLNGRKAEAEPQGIRFRTPESWRSEFGIRSSYRGLIFDRASRRQERHGTVLGVGHKLVNQALRQAKEYDASVASLSCELLLYPIVVYRIQNRLTSQEGVIQSITAGVEFGEDDRLLKDWELLERLNHLNLPRRLYGEVSSIAIEQTDAIREAVARGQALVRQNFEELNAPFTLFIIETLAILWPLDDTNDDC